MQIVNNIDFNTILLFIFIFSECLAIIDNYYKTQVISKKKKKIWKNE